MSQRDWMGPVSSPPPVLVSSFLGSLVVVGLWLALRVRNTASRIAMIRIIKKRITMAKYHLLFIRPSRPSLPKHPFLLNGPLPRQRPLAFLPTFSSFSWRWRRDSMRELSRCLSLGVDGDDGDSPLVGRGVGRRGRFVSVLGLLWLGAAAASVWAWVCVCVCILDNGIPLRSVAC